MKLPAATAYMEALQDPASCFADPELAAGSPLLGPLGLPRAVSGSMATVFRVDGASGRSFAVRCFTRPVPEKLERYAAIRTHLDALRSPWRVAFDLQPRGIRVDGEWWPVVKMAWAAGEPLLSYVERHLWDGSALAYLAVRFAALAETLAADGVAHGDLQHGNILVAPGGDLRLVDYDGMWVPALEGLAGIERGHRNYQHPGRSNADYGPQLDHFSSWVVYASLAALSADPLLWGRLDGGDESLLLREHDLAEPGRSPALAALEASADDGVASLGRMLRGFLAGEASAVPALTPATAPVPAAVAASPGSPVELSERRGLFEVLRGAEAPAPSPPAAAPAPEPPREGADRPAAAAPFSTPLGVPRLALVAALVVSASAWVLAAAGALRPAAAAAVTVAAAGAGAAVVNALFRRTPEVRAAREADADLSGPRRAAAEARAVVDDLVRRRQSVDTDEADAVAALTAVGEELARSEQADLRRVDEELREALAMLGAREQELYRAEQHARATALLALQAEVVDARLGRHRVVAASARGVGDPVVQRLALDGVRTAADLTGVVVDRSGAAVVRRDGRRLEIGGMGPQEATALAGWRRDVEAAARLAVPDCLPREAQAAIRADHDARREAVAREAEAARAAARRRADAVRERRREEHERGAAEIARVRAVAARRRLELDRELAQARKVAAEADWRLAAREREAGGGGSPGLAAYLRHVVTPPARRPR